MAYRRAPHFASDHKVPIAARPTRAIGRNEIGAFSERKKSRQSTDKPNPTNHNAVPMATADVDHGSVTAIATARTSRLNVRADGSCHADNANLIREVVKQSCFPEVRGATLRSS